MVFHRAKRDQYKQLVRYHIRVEKMKSYYNVESSKNEMYSIAESYRLKRRDRFNGRDAVARVPPVCRGLGFKSRNAVNWTI